MTTFGGQTIPPLFVGSAVIEDIVNIDNSTVLGILSWGGFAFPMDPVAVRGHYRVQRRQVSGDTLIRDQNWSGEPPLDPPDFVMNVVGQVGDFADFGSTSWTTFSTACVNIANGARWETAIGVTRTVSVSFTIIYGNALAPNLCPRDSIFSEIGYSLTANFSG